MKRILIFIPLIIILVYFIYTTNSPANHSESVHYHAGFVVYKDGIKQDFSDFKYMNFTPCSVHDAKKSPEEEQIEKAHLHDGVGDVVHVHRQGGTWSDLFKNIQYDIPKDISVTAYKNGQKIDNILSQPINANESIIITIGNSESASLASYVSLDHIKEVEAKSELCGT